MRTSRWTAALLAAGLLGLAGCGGDDAAPEAAPAAADEASASSDSVTVVATEFAFDPVDFSIPADTDVAVTLENAGVVEHDIQIDDPDVHIHAEPTETITETVNLPAGTYEYYCSVPGHRSSGMEGTLTVG
jgi:plastocyanin